jgi:hypothetical protein
MVAHRKPRAFNIGRVRKEYPLKEDDVLELPDAKKAAHCLNWCADHYPNQWIGWNHLYQLIVGQKGTPKLNNRSVELLRGRTGDIRKACEEAYGRTITHNRALAAVRACVDGQDILDSGEMEKIVDRAAGSTRSVVRVGELINVRKLKGDTPKRRQLKAFFKVQVVPMTRSFAAAKFQRRMLTPRRAEKLEAKAEARAARAEAAKKKAKAKGKAKKK